MRALGPHGFLVVTYDEGTSDAGCCGGAAHGGRIPTVIAGPDVRRGARVERPYSLYSVLRTLTDAFGVAPLGRRAPPLGAAFRRPPHL
jgi:hypothetical protein